MKKSITLKPTTTNIYLCSWNGDAIVQIHTKETLYNEYKDTNLFESGDKYQTFDFESFTNLHELLEVWEEKKWDMNNEIYTEDNFTIRLIKSH
tara:strand:+ start:282 stop:560 length:279 start_codon:yes stop_codon:yes gene_type:complete